MDSAWIVSDRPLLAEETKTMHVTEHTSLRDRMRFAAAFIRAIRLQLARAAIRTAMEG